MTKTADAALLLRAILANPGEDTPRLMYADEIDEYQQPQRAEFIRSQCAEMRYLQREFELLCGCEWNGVNWEQWCYAECRDEDGRAVKGNGRGGGMCVYPTPPSLAPAGEPFWVEVPTDGGQVRQFITRGFVAEVRMPLRAFDKKTATALFSEQPVTSVLLSCRHAAQSRGRRVVGHDASWAAPEYEERFVFHQATREAALSGEADYIPREIFELMTGFETFNVPRLSPPGSGFLVFRSSEDAMRSLSNACVEWGRELAGIMPTVPT